MASTQTEDQLVLTPAEQLSLTDVYTHAAEMVRKLASMRTGQAGFVGEVKAFQESWNDNLDMMRAWSGQGATGPIATILANGLTADGRYGPMTGTALGELVFLISEDYDDAGNTAPAKGSDIAWWYAKYRSQIEGALTTDFALSSAPSDVPAPSQQPTIAPPPNETPHESDVGPTGESEMTFSDEEGSTIVSTAARTGWNVPAWAAIVGLVTAGGLVYLIAKKTKRSGSARV